MRQKRLRTTVLVILLWIVWACDCYFFADFLMVRVLLIKNYQIKLLKKVWYILVVLRSLLHRFHFPFNLRHTTTIENISTWKWTEIGTGSGAGAIKKDNAGAGATVMKTNSSGAGAGATFMNRRVLEPELCHFYDGSQPCSYQIIFLK